MPIAPAKFIPYEMKTILIKVYSYRDKNIAGALSNLRLEGDVAFRNTAQMIFGIEQLLDGIQFPQANLTIRSFADVTASVEPQKKPALRPDAGAEKPIATFKFHVLFRQNASWQGTLIWLEDNSEVQFRSVLELLQLLDSVLETALI